MHYTAVTPNLKDTERRLKRGRNAGIATFGLIVATCVALWSAQICFQVWDPAVQPTNTKFADLGCVAGAKKLLQAIADARTHAASEETEAGALHIFRKSIAEVWLLRPNFTQACEGNADGLRLLQQVDRLRYSEEHAVRYRASDLARRRRDVARLLLPAPVNSLESALHQKANP